MANNRKGFIVASDTPKAKFEFSASFKRSFDALIDVYADALAKLNKVASGKDLNSEYGVCSCTYKLRYVTPNDVSTYVSNLVKGLESGLFKDRISDVELFTVASVKRFIEDNGCPAFETSSVINKSHAYVNPKEQTLHDLACICENDIGNVAVYSRGEMLKRLTFIKDDIKKLNDMHFTANMKKIVNAMPSVLDKSESFFLHNKAYMTTFGTFLEEFLLFTCTLNTIAVLQLVGYAKPSVDYTIKQKNENSQDLITECCFINTTTYMVRSKLPFNCNMRDIVLQDVTPDFKDVHDAIHFIMKDPRSPISVLVNKYASKDSGADIMEGDFIGRLFVGSNYKGWSGDFYKKDGRLTETPRSVDNFETDVDWLDNIAFGNNYLDGNYRRDAVGNNAVHPIVNTLDMIYRIYGNCELKTNTDLADNIIRVTGAMKSVISNYKGGVPIENYDITKDVLVVLGEIFTRNMLRLYYNNTQVFTYEDDMPDAGAPGFVCMESFVMEADNNQQTQTTTQQSNGGGNKQSVSFTNGQGQQLKGPGNISNMITKIIDWIKNQLARFSDNFEKRYKAYSDYVVKNNKINDAITEAIKNKTFVPNVTNVPNYTLAVDRHKGMTKQDVTNKLLNPDNKFDKVTACYEIITNKDDVVKAIVDAQNKETDPNKKAGAGWATVGLYFLFGKTEPEKLNGPMTETFWKTLVHDLTECTKFVKEATKYSVDTMNGASEAVRDKENQIGNSDNEAAKTRCAEVTESIKMATECQRKILLNYGTLFFKSKYELYRDIVRGFTQQNNTSTEQPTEPKEQSSTGDQTTPPPVDGVNNSGQTT